MKKRLIALVLCLTVMMTMFAPLANATEEEILLATATPVPETVSVTPEAEPVQQTAVPTEAPAEAATQAPAQQTAEPLPTQEAPQPEQTAPSFAEESISGMTAVTTGSDVNLRTAPGKDSESIGKIALAGTEVTPRKKLTFADGEVWYAVEYQGHTGYIFGDLLALFAQTAAPAETQVIPAEPQVTPAPVITEPDAVYTYEYSNTTSDVVYGYEATATLGQSVSVPRNGRVVLSGPAGQWQIRVGDTWADLAGAETGVALTYALLKNAGASTRIRCLDAAGNTLGESAVTLTDAVSVAAPAQEPVLKKIPLRAAPAADGNADAEAGDEKETYSIVINYVFANGTQAANPWSATIAKGSAYETTVTSPTVVGYTPDQAVVDVKVTNAQADTTYTVTYNAALVNFTVNHFQQNINNDEYTLAETETKTGYTESAVGEKLGKPYTGFTSLLYDTTTKIAADGSTVVEIYYDRNYYLMNFDLDGGYGVDPIYARYGASISIGNPQKAGYSFTGWDKEIPKTMPAENSTYTAQWKPGSVGFTVVFWYENADDANYSVAGTYTPADVAPGTNVKSDDYKNQSFTGRDATHFTYNATKAETVTVAGDGSTVLNVYYTRNTYTLTFRELTCDKWWHTHTDSCYKRVATITAKYGADIHGNFPIKDGDETIWWNVPNGCKSFKPGTQLGSIDIMPGENITFTKDDSESGADIYYYIETLAGEEGTYTHDGKSFKLYKTINLSRGDGKYLTYTEEFHDITGFTQWWSDPAFDQMAQGGKTSGMNSKNYLCYTRNSYKLQFYNYNEFVAGKERTVQYEAPLKDYDFTPAYPSGLEANAYEFAGWYTTAGCYDGSKADLETMTMPASDVILYAKWVPVKHTVTFYLTEEKKEAKEIYKPKGDVEASFSVDHGRNIAKEYVEANLTKDAMNEANPNGNLKFVVWCWRDEEGQEQYFDPNTPVTRDMELYGKWISDSMVEYIIHYQLEDGTEIAPPTTGSALAGTTKTFDAKTGTALNGDYQSGYFPKTNSHSLTMDIEGGNEFIFIYVPKAEVNYTVRYLEKDTNAVLHEEKQDATRDAVITEKFVQINGYAPDAYQKRLVLSADEATNVITFWYVKDEVHAPVQVIHWTQNIAGDGYTEYQSSTNLNGVIDNVYSEDSLTIPGFTYKEEKSNASGTLTAEGLVLNLYYDRIEYPYEFRFLKQGTNEVLADPVTGQARYQAQVTQTAKDIPGYKLVSAENQAINIAIEDPADTASKNVKIFYYVEETVDIKYEVVGGGGTLDNYQDNTVPVFTGTVQGSKPTAAADYRFVGWYTDAACTNPVDAKWVNAADNKLTPQKTAILGTELAFESATYYAKFQKQTSVTIKKLVTDGVGIGDRDKAFEFQYSWNGTDWIDMTPLKDGQSFTTSEKVDVGTMIYVREKADGNYVTTAAHNGGALSVTEANGYRQVMVTVLDNDTIIFTNQKQEQTVDISYVVVGDTANTLDNYLDDKIPVLSGPVSGSTPTAATGYRFVGWFTDAACDTPVNPEWVDADNKLTPQKTRELGTPSLSIMAYEAATYYAKFVKQTNVTVEKQVTGNLGDQSKDFEFQYSLDGVTWSETKTLKHGESFVTTDVLDVDTEIWIREATAPGYTTTVAHNNSGRMEFTKVDGYQLVKVTVKDGEKVVFTNDKTTVPDTGVLLDSLPYVLILVAVALGVVLVIVRRRKHRDDD